MLWHTWTYALCHAVNFHNSSLWKGKSISPYEAFTGETLPWAIAHFRVFGSPTYILQKKLQDGSSLDHLETKSLAWRIHWQFNMPCQFHSCHL